MRKYLPLIRVFWHVCDVAINNFVRLIKILKYVYSVYLETNSFKKYVNKMYPQDVFLHNRSDIHIIICRYTL